jgi:hypothetical protein
VDDEIAGLDPPPHRTGSDPNTFGHLGDREESDSIAGVTTTVGDARGVHQALPASEISVSNEA